jgi:hypothetical protein
MSEYTQHPTAAQLVFVTKVTREEPSMPLNSDLKSHYEAVLQDLESERQQVQQQIAASQARLKELHTSIVTLTKRINPDAPSYPTAPLRPAHTKYTNISVRWAILDFLNDSQAMTTPEIAEALKAAGIQTRAANFANNVSAVLSTTMCKEHAEVQQLPDGKWELTEKGQDAIAHIRTTPRFRRAVSWSA